MWQYFNVDTNILTLWSWPWILTNFLKTYSLLITFEQWMLELWYFTWVYSVTRPFRGFQHRLPWIWSLTFFSENVTLAINFWTVIAKALIFHVSITCDKTFLQIPTFLYWYQGICSCELCHLWNWPLSGTLI